MAEAIEGTLDAKGMRFGIIVSRFNNFVTERLLDGALEAFTSHGAQEKNITIVRVPGAFEIALMAQKLAASGKYDALVCLGAIIRGDTPHFDYIAQAVTKGISKAVWQNQLPISFGVLTTNNVEQAMDRAGSKDSNKGYEAALTAIEMVSLNRRLS
jgi:6,7-dimethyl-8-ribityllumazine synthase